MENKFTFTQARIKALPLPDKSRVMYYDSEVSKLACRVSSTGSKTYVVVKRFNGKIKTVTLGKTSDIPVKKAQDMAKIEISNMAQGIDPTKEKLKDMALGEALENYIKNRHPKNGRDLKERTVKGYRYAMTNSYKDWLYMPVRKITPDMVAKRHASLTRVGATTANVSARVLRLTLKHAKTIGVVDSVATDILVDGKKWNANNRRVRVIKMSSLPAWFDSVNALENERAKVYLLMLIFMGFRSAEARLLKWEDIDLNKKTITARDTKNGTDFTQPIPLNFLPYLTRLQVITGNSIWVFSGADTSKAMSLPNKPMGEVISQTGNVFSSHDLRRSFAGYAEAAGVPFSIIKKLLNHTTSATDVTMGYLITESETLADNINRVGSFIHEKATQKDNVIQLRANK
jgi:integrase